VARELEARPFRLADLDRLEPGARADIVIIDMTGRDTLRMGPVRDPIKSLVDCGIGDDIDTVIVDGVIRKRDGRLTGDLETAAERLEASRRFVFDAADLADILGPSFTV